MSSKKLLLTVINDLNYDQRMIRICTALHKAGYQVTLIGRSHPWSEPLQEQPFQQKRLFIRPEKGKIMYLLYWIRLFFYLCFKKADLICAIDLDTILPVYAASVLKRCKRVYDAHELFTEMKEVVTRPREKKLWDRIERFAVPRFPKGYTIGTFYAREFERKYRVKYAVVRNATVLRPFEKRFPAEKYLLYQGWVNKGRCFEELIPAMQHIDIPLVVCGEGNFFVQARALAREYGVEDKIRFKGYIAPEQLQEYTKGAYAGLTLFHGLSKSNELSLANRFFDYMHHGVPQIAMRFPEYEKINSEFELAILLEDPPAPQAIAAAVNQLLDNPDYWSKLSRNAMKAREVYCWQHEEKVLLDFYRQVFAQK